MRRLDRHDNGALDDQIQDLKKRHVVTIVTKDPVNDHGQTLGGELSCAGLRVVLPVSATPKKVVGPLRSQHNLLV
jgi:hypothetical protein